MFKATYPYPRLFCPHKWTICTSAKGAFMS